MAGQTLPPPFCRGFSGSFGVQEAALLFGALDTDPPVSIRFNPFKLAVRPEGHAVPWSRYGFYLDSRPQFTLDPLFHGGAYYVQEASSMFIEAIYRQCFPDHIPERVLDLCAAPGGKTTHLSALVGAEGLVVANETIRQRAQILVENVKKWGVGNVAVTNNDPAHFSSFENWFDMVLVDAPCSGEGMFRKDREARSQWSEANVKLCASRAQRIISDVWSSLRPGGVLLFSTCTFNATENEKNIEWLTQEYDCEPVDIKTDPSWGIDRGEVNGMQTFRFYPHKLRGEGFFAAVLRKAGGNGKQKTPKPRKTAFAELTRKETETASKWVNQPEYMHFAKVGDNIHASYANTYPALKQLADNLTVIYSGIRMGQIFGTQLKPEHPLAMFHDVAHGITPEVNLTTPQILAYLRKTDIDPQLFHEGVNMVCFNNLPLGWIKRISNRTNNLYPKEMRILNL